MAEEGNSMEAVRPNDFVDDLFDYDVGLDGVLQEINTNSNSANAPKQPNALDNSGVVLGLDEEVKVAKKRQPVAKLDENRLLTQAGIPKLRSSARKNLNFKGKGHEFSDLARLLNFYQLWLDDLFPRAKFADGLAIIERLGHSKRLQTMRRTWIDEEKPRYAEDDAPETSNKDNNSVNHDTLMTEVSESIPNNPLLDDTNQDDLFMPHDASHERPLNDKAAPPDDDLDELDALLREQGTESQMQNATLSREPGRDNAPPDDELDELDALLGGQGDQPGTDKNTSTDAASNHHAPPDDDLDELDDLLREHEDEPNPQRNTSTKATSHEQAPPDEGDLDELDALLREHEDEPDMVDQGQKTRDDHLETESHADELEAMKGLDMDGEAPEGFKE